MILIFVIGFILILSVILTCRENYAAYPYYNDYFSGDGTDCDNGCCDPVMCSLKGQCVWHGKSRYRTYSGQPETCLDFKNCLNLNPEEKCLENMFGL